MLSSKHLASTRLAKFITKRILELRPKTQALIANQAGFVNVNMLSMIKTGATKLPLDRVVSLAGALEVDPAYLLRLALEQMMPNTDAQAIIEIMNTAVTRNEMAWVTAIRDASDHSDPPLTRRGQAAIFGVFGK